MRVGFTPVASLAMAQLLAGFLWVLPQAGCSRAPVPQGPEYADTPGSRRESGFHLAVHPLHNPGKLLASYGPLADHLSARMPGLRFEVEPSRDYGEFERKYRAQAVAFILPNPWQCLEAMKTGYEVIAMAGEPADFKGIILVRKDSPVRQVKDLKGQAVSYPAPTALAACLLPQWFLHTNGLDVNRDIENRYVGSQESSLLNVYHRQTAAGATWPAPWRAFCREHPREAGELKILWETPAMMNNAVMVRSDVAPAVRDEVLRLLLHLHETPAGQAILAGMETARFLPVGNADYEPVRRFVAAFEAGIRPVEKP